VGGRYALSQLLTSVGFRTSAVCLAASRAAAGEGARTWTFDFAGRSGVDGLSTHCLDLPFAWDLLDAEGVTRVLGDAPSQGLADTMHADWVRFIREGSLPWPAAGLGPAGARRYEHDGAVDDAESYRLEVEAGGIADAG
jgi:para-nitrobenzyl esterase